MIEVRSFLGHASFYQRFIKDFLKISKPLFNILEKEVPYKFDDKFLQALQALKRSLCHYSFYKTILEQAYELMCDVSDFSNEAILR